jgi:hypothetical protein
MARGDKQRIGLAGEHYVASELLRRDWNAALTFGNTAHTDVLAERGDTRKPITIQVKAKQRRGGGWWMPGPADPARRDVDEWFIFVDFAVEEGATPVVYVVPRDHVAALRGCLEAAREAGRQSEISPSRLGPR